MVGLIIIEPQSPARSKVRSVRTRNRSIFSGIKATQVFRADIFQPFADRPTISDSRGPGHSEDVFIFDSELNLKEITSVSRFDVYSNYSTQKPKILFRISFQCFFRGFVVDQPVTFHNMECLSVRGAIPIDHGERSVGLDPNRVYYQRITLVMANRVPIPGRRDVLRMSYRRFLVTA